MSETVTVTKEDYAKFNGENRLEDCTTHCLLATALRRHFNTEDVREVIYTDGIVDGIGYTFHHSDPDFCFHEFVDSALMGRLDPTTLPITFELEPVNS